MSALAVLWILVIGMMGVGIFALRGAIKNSFKNVESKTSKARLVRGILGEEGYRYFVGILGAGFIIASLGLIFLMTGGLNLVKSENPETDIIEISIKSEEPGSTSTLMATEAQLRMTYDAIGDRNYDTYQHISFKNHYRSTLPDLLWMMKNLESIDLTNNEFTELPLDQLKQLPKLKQLILDGNPIEPTYLAQIKSSLVGIQVVKVDVIDSANR